MDLKQIKELMVMMEKSGITKLRIQDNYEIELERKVHHDSSTAIQPVTYHPHIDLSLRGEHAPAAHRQLTQEEKGKAEGQKVEGKFITAPLVGTVYYAPSPENPSFVKVGDQVSENSVVCIIEAMKVMNEVKSGISGTVAEILVSNGHPVEFATKLIRIV
ncbi:MAG: acetyl-CoA carboxylase biotin carboxyl carrier protein [Candidatus Rhabdochlamydia sp.]